MSHLRILDHDPTDEELYELLLVGLYYLNARAEQQFASGASKTSVKKIGFSANSIFVVLQLCNVFDGDVRLGIAQRPGLRELIQAHTHEVTASPRVSLRLVRQCAKIVRHDLLLVLSRSEKFAQSRLVSDAKGYYFYITEAGRVRGKEFAEGRYDALTAEAVWANWENYARQAGRRGYVPQ